MGKSLLLPKDTVRIRSMNMCEKCGRELTSNVNGIPDADTARSIHHRHKKSEGGRDSVICMVNLCVRCHRAIHADEKQAQVEGWIVVGRSPGRVPFCSWRGWVVPLPDGGLTLLDFETGRTSLVPFPRAPEETPPRPRRKRVADRPQYDKRRKSRQISRVA